MHHWAHAGRRNCDPWWENETPWHRGWKDLFPEECREISHTAPDGEVHRADIKTPTGIVIEVQRSAMTDQERLSREAFYGNLIWVLDGSVFRDSFEIHHMLPDPGSLLAKDLVWAKAQRGMHGANGGMFFRVSECQQYEPRVTKATLHGGEIHGLRDIEDQVRAEYRGHHQYVWVRPRRTWLDATCPVYIDFGDEWLAKLGVYDESRVACVLRVRKQDFVHAVMAETNARTVATQSDKIA